MIKRNVQIRVVLLTLFSFFAFTASAQNAAEWETLKGELSFFLANDLGRNGYYDQKPIAELMGEMADVVGPECVIAAGDVHHFNGVSSVNDPLWMTNYELVYSHPELMIEWFPVLGNHEYRGSTQAVLDYSKISRRWVMPERYYTRVFEEDGLSVRIIWVDTTPLIDKYRVENDKYPDAYLQDNKQQLVWVDSVLTVSKEEWVLVVGHHPIYAYTPKDESERMDMQRTLDSVLRRHKVDMYLCGHIHNFQYIRPADSTIDYVVNSSASLARSVQPIEGTKFCSSESGFSVITAEKERLRLSMIDKNGKILYTVDRSK